VSTRLEHLRETEYVLELVRAIRAPRTMADDLDPSVREKFLEPWHAAQAADHDE